MKNLYPKSGSAVLKLCIALLVTSVAIIYGCKKEHPDNKDAPSTPDSQTITDAKTWFEKTYPIGSTSGQTNHTNSTGTGVDLSQKIKPDWQHTATYARLGKDVIEMPIDPESKFGSILKKKVNNHTYSKTYTRSSYLLLKGAKGYQAYIMTIVGDSSYIKGDPTKLTNNTYRQHDADFSGLVLYFTPKGKYLNGYAYKNGQLVTPASQAQSTPGKIKVQLAEICTDWYDEILINNVIVSSTYLYTTCTGGDEEPADPSASSGGSPAPPNQCIPQPQPPTGPEPPSTPNPPTGPIIPVALPGGHLTVNNVPGGGFPPPTDEDEPCHQLRPDTINKVKDPCLNATINAMINKNLEGKMADIINNVFNSTDKVNLTFKEFNDPNAKPARTDVPTRIDGVFNETINLNLAQLKDASMEFKTIITIHEILHAYMNYNDIYKTQLRQHQEMAEKYVEDIKNFTQQLYSINDQDAYAIILNGLSDVFGDNKPLYLNTLKTKYKVTDVLGTYELQRVGIYGTKCK